MKVFSGHFVGVRNLSVFLRYLKTISVGARYNIGFVIPLSPVKSWFSLILGLHGQKHPSQIPLQSLPSYDERFYSLGVLRCLSFYSIGTSVDFLISREDYPMASLVGMNIRVKFQSAVFFPPGR